MHMKKWISGRRYRQDERSFAGYISVKVEQQNQLLFVALLWYLEKRRSTIEAHL